MKFLAKIRSSRYWVPGVSCTHLFLGRRKGKCRSAMHKPSWESCGSKGLSPSCTKPCPFVPRESSSWGMFEGPMCRGTETTSPRGCQSRMEEQCQGGLTRSFQLLGVSDYQASQDHGHCGTAGNFLLHGQDENSICAHQVMQILGQFSQGGAETRFQLNRQISDRTFL